MPTVTLTLRESFEIAVRNPDDEGQVYMQSGGSIDTYVNIESATFANAVAVSSQIGSTGFWEATIRIPDVTGNYPITVWPSTATAFSNAESFEGVWSPKNEPANVTQFGGSSGTFSSGIPAVNATQISGDSTAADNLEAAADGTGYNLGGGSIVAASVTGAVGSISGVSFPSNFSTLGINASGHVSRVVLVDTTTTLTNAPSGGLDAAGVRSAIGLAAANLDTQLDALPTTAEMWSYGERRLTDGTRVWTVPTIQQAERQIVQGDSYSITARAIAINASDGGEWPTDLSEYTWTCTLAKDPDNANSGDATVASTITVSTATGSSRSLRMALTTTQTAGMALGRYNYGVQGVKGGEKWTVEVGSITVVEDYTT